jgi:hypothetical protein
MSWLTKFIAYSNKAQAEKPGIYPLCARRSFPGRQLVSPLKGLLILAVER